MFLYFKSRITFVNYLLKNKYRKLDKGYWEKESKKSYETLRVKKKSKKEGKGKKGDGKDNAHYPGTNRTRLMSASRNRGTERRKPRTGR